MEIKGKNVFITGSSRGIGLAIAKEFSSLGANIVLNGRSNLNPEVMDFLKVQKEKSSLFQVMFQIKQTQIGWFKKLLTN